jgi:hypothetical protein
MYYELCVMYSWIQLVLVSAAPGEPWQEFGYVGIVSRVNMLLLGILFP